MHTKFPCNEGRCDGNRMPPGARLFGAPLLWLSLCCADAYAQAAEGTTLPAVQVRSERTPAERNQLPNTTESITAAQMADTINATSVEDALKYLPNVLVRKRYAGDTQAPMATRTTGINASARSLVFVDGMLLSTLINNNNANGSPQWFMVSPDEIARIDVLYGPFSAAYAGNSYGAVTEITTRMPTAFEATARVVGTSEAFRHYGTSDTFRSGEAAASLGNRNGSWRWRLDVGHLDTDSRPLTYLSVNQSAAPAGAALPVIGGALADRNRTGGNILVTGAGNLTHTVQDTAKLKAAYAFDRTLVATYTLGYWQNRADADARSYLTTADGAPYYGAAAGNLNLGGRAYSAAIIGSLLSSNRVEQEHWMQHLALRQATQGNWRWEVDASAFTFGRDLTRTSTGLYPAAKNGGAGRVADAAGTGWSTLDAKAFFHSPAWPAHSISFGAHVDHYRLFNPTTTVADWRGDDAGSGGSGGSGGAGSNANLFSDSRGKTRTEALWLQDLWQLTPRLTATLGLRDEFWRAYDGFNFARAANGRGFPVTQPEVARHGLSPKAALSWQLDGAWSLTGSAGRALRFPTVGELYQNVQTGTTFTQADPFLQPERVVSAELALERHTDAGRARLSLFQENVRDALISQTASLPGVALPVSFVQNIDRTRQRGIELVLEQKDVLWRGLDLTGNVTYVDARILANRNYVATVPGASSVGQRTPYVPAWRATAVATYRPDERWAYTLAARASTRLFATVDNTDINPATYQGFQGFVVADARVRYRIDRQWSAAVGIDNLTDRDYFLFHSFPQRTLLAELRYAY